LRIEGNGSNQHIICYRFTDIGELPIHGL